MTLDLQNLTLEIGNLRPVDHVTLHLPAGRTIGIVGESGSGKTLTALSIIGLQPDGAAVSGAFTLDSTRLDELSERGWSQVRGTRIAMVFQNAQLALDPLMRIGPQLRESLRAEVRAVRRTADAEILALVEAIRLKDPARILRAYPHELSGGERQRVLIAMALAGRPEVILADEPTTALDSITRVAVLRLLKQLAAERGFSLILITHDLAVVAALCDEVAVFYGGRVVEHGATPVVLGSPRHRYTAALLAAIPTITVRGPGEGGRRLPTIRGSVPALGAFPTGCVFRDRCDFADQDCQAVPPSRAIDGRDVACFHPAGQTTA